mmetsp:Transcript_5248/g.18867  ORF Transcript_5248/g.18867 Transcript_5248/m.18867 type:complete len:216 (-) Transcript_5248:351-998(-)
MSHARSAYGSSASASGPPSSAIRLILASSVTRSSSPSACSSDVSVYFANASKAPPSMLRVDRGQDVVTPGNDPLPSEGVYLLGTALSRRRRKSVNLIFPPTTGGAIGRRRTLLRSAILTGVKHIGHFACSPSLRFVTACRAMHAKQNECPQSVTCGAFGGSSRHTGHASGAAAPSSTATTSSQSTMWSGSVAAPLRSAQSATKNRKLAWRNSSLR